MSDSIVFLDFDGVVVDSIDECYLISKLTFMEEYEIIINDNIKFLFYKLRGLVGPPFEYYCLINSILKYPDSESKILEHFNLSRIKKKKIYFSFEKLFFKKRKQIQNNLKYWCGLHKLTSLGIKLKSINLDNFYVVSTKDDNSIIILLEFFNIKIQKNRVFGNKSFKKHKHKGNVINHILSNKKKYKSGIFIDDSIDHLLKLDNNKIKPYFYPSGYGQNTNFDEYYDDIL